MLNAKGSREFSNIDGKSRMLNLYDNKMVCVYMCL